MLFSQNHQPQQSGSEFRTGINVFYLALNGFATCFTVFFRRSFGGEAFGVNALAAIGIMIFFMMSYPHSPGILAMFSLWWIALVLQRLGHFSRRLRGILLHGRFEGISWFETILPFLGPNVARVLEAATCGLLGASQSELDPGVAAFFTLGGVALFVKWIIDGHIDHLRVQRMNNAAIEHRATVARWHRGRSW